MPVFFVSNGKLFFHSFQTCNIIGRSKLNGTMIAQEHNKIMEWKFDSNEMPYQPGGVDFNWMNQNFSLNRKHSRLTVSPPRIFCVSDGLWLLNGGIKPVSQRNTEMTRKFTRSVFGAEKKNTLFACRSI